MMLPWRYLLVAMCSEWMLRQDLKPPLILKTLE